MVLPPWYEEMRRARVEETPRAFREVLEGAGLLGEYRLEEVPPSPWQAGFVGPVQRSSFEVWKNGSATGPAAILRPDGSTECSDVGFSAHLAKMLELIDRAGQKAHDDFLREYARQRDEERTP